MSKPTIVHGLAVIALALVAAACGGDSGGDSHACSANNPCPAGFVCDLLSGTCATAVRDAGIDASIDAPGIVDAPPPDAAPPACDGGVVECGNLLVNGGFEEPVIGANSDVYSTDPSYLPGWTLSAGGNQFFQENGQPFGRARYTEGSQSICLNADGGPNVYIEQTFATVAGASYHLSFAMTDEQGAGPSACSVKVDVAGTTTTFTRANDTGFVTKELTFTATASTTTLRITDTTPGSSSLSNPLIDAVLVRPSM